MTTVWSTREKQRLNADRQRLERAKDHLRLDKEHMDAENMELSKEILEQTKEYRARKEELLEERGILQVREQPTCVAGVRKRKEKMEIRRAREARGECAKHEGRERKKKTSGSSVPSRSPARALFPPSLPFSSACYVGYGAPSQKSVYARVLFCNNSVLKWIS